MKSFPPEGIGTWKPSSAPQAEAEIFADARSKAKQPTVYEFKVRQLKVLVTVKLPYFVPARALRLHLGVVEMAVVVRAFWRPFETCLRDAYT